MPPINPPRPLKVCHTCRHWIYQYKGLCERLGQGVGKFWFCEEWAETPAGNPGPQAANPGKSAASSPQ